MESVSVLTITANADFGDRLATALEDQRVSIQVQTVTDAEQAVERLESESVDCVVGASAPGDGASIASVRTVREQAPELPYILFAEESSVDSVREAVSVGVTDYLPYDSNQDQFPLLADRVIEVVARHRDVQRTEKLQRINTVIRDLDRVLVHASTRDKIDRQVCEIFSQSDPYHFAWIGEPDPETGRVTLRSAAGVEKGYLDDVTIKTDAEPEGLGPTGTAVRTREMAVMQNIPENPAYEPWREQALERGYKSSAAVPLVHDETLYGVLNVYADRVEAFDEDERELLEEVSEDIAYALHKVQLRKELRRFQRIVETARDAIIVLEPDGTIEYANPAFEDLTGYTATEAVGQNVRILRSDSTDTREYEKLWETVHAGDVWEGEIVNTRQSGEDYYAEQTVTPLTDETGATEGYVAIQRDVTERKSVEEELRERKSHLKQAQEIANLGSWYLDIQADELEWSDEVFEIFELPADQSLTYEQFLQYIHPEDQEFVDEQWASALEGAPYDIEHRIQVDGKTKWVHEKAELEFGEDGTPLEGIGVIQDITEQKEREQRLEQFAKTLQTIRNVNKRLVRVQDQESVIDEVTEVISEHDSFSRVFLALLDDDQVQSASEAGTTLTQEQVRAVHSDSYIDEVFTRGGLHIDDVTDSSYYQHFGDESPHEALALPIRTASRNFGILTIHFVPGESPIDEEVELLKELGNDIAYTLRNLQLYSELRERDEQLEEWTVFIDRITDAIDDIFYILDTDGSIRLENQSAREVWGYSDAELEEMTVAELVSDEDGDNIEKFTEEVLETGSARTEVDVVTDSGHRIPYEFRASVVEHPDGETVIAGVGRNITELVKRTRQLRVLDRVLRHNLHNDMTIIKGYAQTIRDASSDENLKTDAATIIDASEQLLETVDKERDIVQTISEAPNRSAVNVASIIQKVAEDANEDYPDADITLDLPDEAIASATTDIERALRELVENAITYSDREPPAVSITATQRDETVRIDVADNGPGIPDEEAEVLTQGRELEPLYHGSGLGLWLVNWIVRRSNGTLKFEENDPRGSVVTIELAKSESQ